MSGDFSLGSKSVLKLDPLILAVQQDDYLSVGAGASLESSNLAVNTVVFGDNGKNVNIQSGFSLKFNVVSVYYNYQFNVISGNSLLPFSLLHQVGLAFSLNNVEKRKAFKTINFPKL